MTYPSRIALRPSFIGITFHFHGHRSESVLEIQGSACRVHGFTQDGTLQNRTTLSHLVAGVDQIHALVDVSSDGLGGLVSGIGCHGGVCLIDGCVSDIDQFGEVFVLVLVISVVIIVTVVVAVVTLIVGLLLTGSVALLALTGSAVASGIAIAGTGIAGLVSIGPPHHPIPGRHRHRLRPRRIP